MAETIEKILQLKKHLERYFEREDAVEKILYVFKKLERLPVNLDILQDTGIGKTVNSYRKHGEGVGDRARELVAYWKQLLAEQSEPEATIKTETAHETTYDSTMRIPNMESPPKQSSKSKDSSSKKSCEEPSRRKAKIHTMSDSEDEGQQVLHGIKEEPSSPEHVDHSNEKHSSDKHHSENTKHHKIKVEPTEETTSYEKPIEHQKIKTEPSSDKDHKHKHHKDKKREKSSSSSKSDKRSASKHHDERKSESRHDHKSSKHDKYGHKDSNDSFSSNLNGVDISIVKDEAEEERKKLKAKALKAENNVRDESTMNDVDLSLVKKEKEDKSAQKDNKEHASSSHRSKQKHHKHDKHKDERSDKVKKDVRTEETASISIKQEKVESENEQSRITEHKGKGTDKATEQSKDREQKNKHNTTVKIKTEKDAESNEKQKSVALDPGYDNHGMSFEDMLMAGVPKKKKKKPSGTSVNAASTSTNSPVKFGEEKRDKHKNNQQIDSSSSSHHHKQDKHNSSSGKSTHERHHKSSHKDRNEKSSSKEKSSHKRKHKDKEDKDERKEKKLKLDIPEPPKEKLNLEPTDLMSTLPDISPNYKPLPKIDMTSPSRHLAIEEIANTIGTKTHTRTQVYSGRRTKFLPTVPSLYDSCLLILQENIDSLDFVGGVPYDILKPVLEKATPNQLYNIEDSNPQFIGETEELWEKHCKKDFRNKQKDEFEAWRELYIRCHDDRDRKLKALTAKVSLNMAKSLPVRQTKLAYVDVSAKPPRGVRRAQIKNGTAGSMNKQDPLAKLSSHADSKPVKVPAPPREAPGRPPMMQKKVKTVAPMMKKTLRFIKNVPSLRRK